MNFREVIKKIKWERWSVLLNALKCDDEDDGKNCSNSMDKK